GRRAGGPRNPGVVPSPPGRSERMNLFGSTRSRVCRDHALIAPDSFVRSTLPGWEQTEIVVLISPHLGARFTQYLAFMAAGAVSGAALLCVDRVLYVLDCDVTLQTGWVPVH